MQDEEKKKDYNIVLYLIGYYVLGSFWFFLQTFPIPLGAIVGGIRIYKFYKKDNSFKWKLRTTILVIGVVLAIMKVGLLIPFTLNFPGK